MNMDDIDKIISLIMEGEDLDDDVKVRVYTSSNEIKNRPNKPNKGYEGGISKSGKFKDFYQSNDKILKGTYNKLVAVRKGIGLLKENLESMLKIVNELNEDLKNV